MADSTIKPLWTFILYYFNIPIKQFVHLQRDISLKDFWDKTEVTRAKKSFQNNLN